MTRQEADAVLASWKILSRFHEGLNELCESLEWSLAELDRKDAELAAKQARIEFLERERENYIADRSA